jgi:hypothetical protein
LTSNFAKTIGGIAIFTPSLSSLPPGARKNGQGKKDDKIRLPVKSACAILPSAPAVIRQPPFPNHFTECNLYGIYKKERKMNQNELETNRNEPETNRKRMLHTNRIEPNKNIRFMT